MRRLLAVAGASVAVVLMTGSTATAQVPTCAPAPVPVIGCAEPTFNPDPTATPTPTGLPTLTPSPTPSPSPAPDPTPTTSEPAFTPLPTGDSGIGVLPGGPSPAPAPTTTTPAPAPSVAPSTVPVSAPLASGPVQLAGVFGLVLGGLLGLPLLLAWLAAQGRLAAPLTAPLATTGGTVMPTRRNRLYLGAGFLALAAIVGIVGWYKLSGEPLVNRQLPYLASAGMAVVVLAAIGGSMLVAEQLRSDAGRIDELENAVRTLAAALAPSIEAPPRGRDAAPTAVLHDEVAAEHDTENVKVVTPPARRAATKTRAARAKVKDTDS